MKLLEYVFICPNCEKEFYTYAESIKLQQYISREYSVDDIFNNMPTQYRRIFATGFCDKCQNNLQQIENRQYCSEVNTNDNYLYNHIKSLYSQ